MSFCSFGDITVSSVCHFQTPQPLTLIFFLTWPPFTTTNNKPTLSGKGGYNWQVRWWQISILLLHTWQWWRCEGAWCQALGTGESSSRRCAAWLCRRHRCHLLPRSERTGWGWTPPVRGKQGHTIKKLFNHSLFSLKFPHKGDLWQAESTAVFEFLHIKH